MCGKSKLLLLAYRRLAKFDVQNIYMCHNYFTKRGFGRSYSAVR